MINELNISRSDLMLRGYRGRSIIKRALEILQPKTEIFLAQTSLYLPDFNNPEEFGVDMSKYNGPINTQLLFAWHNRFVRYVMIRCGISWGYEDPQFLVTALSALSYTTAVMPYWVIYPDQRADRQAENCRKILSQVDWSETPKILWVDLELSRGCSRSKVMTKTWEVIQEIQNRLPPGWTVGVYSGAWFINGYCEQQPWVDQVWWWMASYLTRDSMAEHPGPPTISWIPRERVAFHQTGDYCNGIIMGTSSSGGRIDSNRYELHPNYPDPWGWLKDESTPPSPNPITIEFTTEEAREILAASIMLQTKLEGKI
jgi:GH25 family lysozyme M1 (1,4-beta-N-acetylmuramidase)